MTTIPSGRQIPLVAGDYQATIVEVGGGVRSLTYRGRDLLVSYDRAEIQPGYRGGVLAPWPCRVADGRYTFDGDDHQLPITEVERNCALHGLVGWVPWTIGEVTESSASLSVRIVPSPGYEFALLVEVDYQLDPVAGLTMTIRATNTGDRPAPYGGGWHPYLTLPGRALDETTLTLPCAVHVVSDERIIPVGDENVAGTDWDFRSGRRLAGVSLDDCFGRFDRDGDGRAWASLAHGSDAVWVWADEAYKWFVVYTMDGPQGGEARAGVTVEPLTCPPNAFNSGTDLVVLAPGETHAATSGVCATH